LSFPNEELSLKFVLSKTKTPIFEVYCSILGLIYYLLKFKNDSISRIGQFPDILINRIATLGMI